MTTAIESINTPTLNQKENDIQLYGTTTTHYNQNNNATLNDKCDQVSTQLDDNNNSTGNDNGKALHPLSSLSSTDVTSSTLDSQQQQNASNNNPQWGSFAGFHWDVVPTSVNKIPPDFCEQKKLIFQQQQQQQQIKTFTPPIFENNNNILSVPMLPNVTPEPFYRQQRSLSFPMIDAANSNNGDDHDPNTINNINKCSHKSLLATMAEEDDRDDICNFNNNLHDFDDLNPSMKNKMTNLNNNDSNNNNNNNLSHGFINPKLRFRSQSSGAALELSPHYFNHPPSLATSSMDPSFSSSSSSFHSNFQRRSSLSSTSTTPSTSTPSLLRRSSDFWDTMPYSNDSMSDYNDNKRRHSSIASLWNNSNNNCQDNNSFIHSMSSMDSYQQQQQQQQQQQGYPLPLVTPIKDLDQESLYQRRLSQPLDLSFSENYQNRKPLGTDYSSYHQHGYTTKSNIYQPMENINLNQKPPSPTSCSNVSSIPSINQPPYPQQQHYFSIPAANSQPSQLQPAYPYQSYQDIPSHPYSYSYGQNNNNNNNMMMMNSLVLPLTPPLNPHLTTQQQSSSSSSSAPLPQSYYQQHPLDINDPYSIYYQTIKPSIPTTTMTTSSIMTDNNNPHTTTTFSSCTMGKNLSSNTNISPLEEENRMLNDVGKGIPLNQLHPEAIIYMIEFKSRRIDFFYFDSHQQQQQQQMILNSSSSTATSSTSSHLSPFSVGLGDLVIVEADRGKDLGKVAMIGLTSDQVLHILKRQQELKQEQMKSKMNQSTVVSSIFEKDQQQQQEGVNKDEEGNDKKEEIDYMDDEDEETKKEMLLQEPVEIIPEQIFIKRIYRLATPEEINMLLIKSQDEQRALVICQQKVKQRKLQMEVVDAEYQWDRRKLTFYFEAEKRIDFRDLVREMFKIYKTRIWMCTVNNKKSAIDF
ncbi:unnamed protein product [Cunninghamella echinulata]